MMGRYEVFQDLAGQWRWRLKARNGEVVAQSESYTHRWGARKGAMAARRAGLGARVVDA